MHADCRKNYRNPSLRDMPLMMEISKFFTPLDDLMIRRNFFQMCRITELSISVVVYCIGHMPVSSHFGCFLIVQIWNLVHDVQMSMIRSHFLHMVTIASWCHINIRWSHKWQLVTLIAWGHNSCMWSHFSHVVALHLGRILPRGEDFYIILHPEAGQTHILSLTHP